MKLYFHEIQGYHFSVLVTEFNSMCDFPIDFKSYNELFFTRNIYKQGISCIHDQCQHSYTFHSTGIIHLLILEAN